MMKHSGISAPQKNEIVTLSITDQTTEGEGIGKLDGFPLFVKDTVIGDVVTAKVIKTKKTYGYGRLMEVQHPSPDRVEPACPLSRPCGGCQLQALSYEKQLEFKTAKVLGNLERIGGFAAPNHIEFEQILGMDVPYRYRNKAQYPVGRDRDGMPIAGFYAGRTHSIVPVTDCLLGVEENQEILSRILSYMRDFHVSPYDEETGEGLVRHILIRKGFYTGQIMVCIVVNGKTLPGEAVLVKSLCEVDGMASISLNENRTRGNVILGAGIRPLYGTMTITDTISDLSFEISPLSFYQVNPIQTQKLYGKALEFASLTGTETVWDLYCGIGTISLFLARHAKKVYGVEIVPQAVEDARRNAEKNGIRNAEFYAGKAEVVVPALYEKEGIHADVIVVDPPRKGCDEVLLQTMVQMQPDRIVYVSCDSATLARDLRILCSQGYELRKVCPVDMFPQSVHVEVVSLLASVPSQ